MGRIFIDGFESGGMDLWEGITGSPSVSSAQAHTGTYALRTGVGSVIDYVTKSIAALSTIYFKFSFYLTAVGSSGGGIFQLSDSVGAQISLFISASRYLELRRGSPSGTTLGTSLNPIPMNTWCLIEGKITIANTGGIGQIKLNGALEIDYTGDTQYQTGNTATRVMLGSICLGGANMTAQYTDDLVLDDAAWIGDTKIQGLRVSGAGAAAQWTPSAGANYECVDEVPAADADYVSTTAADQLDLFAATDPEGAIANIRCVQVQARVVKEGSPMPQNIQMACRTGGGNYFSSSLAMPAGVPKSVCKVWENNPNTGAAWTPAEVSGLEIGYKSAA